MHEYCIVRPRGGGEGGGSCSELSGLRFDGLLVALKCNRKKKREMIFLIVALVWSERDSADAWVPSVLVRGVPGDTLDE